MSPRDVCASAAQAVKPYTAARDAYFLCRIVDIDLDADDAAAAYTRDILTQARL